VPATLESNLRETLQKIGAEARRYGRSAGDVRLLAVTKSVGSRTAQELVRLGQKDLGENRLASLVEKRASLEAAGLTATWHFIGQIQRNKARRVIQNSEVLHSVDSLKLIETLERIASEEKREVGVYLEVKLSSESTKHGFAAKDLTAAVEYVGTAQHLKLLGLMTMAPRPQPGDNSQDQADKAFGDLEAIALKLQENPEHCAAFEDQKVRLSMGMSGDFKTAIQRGSSIVRIGSALFHDITTDTPTSGVAS
jgi:pyridoxal phosphate enzyme (YggS family)